MSHHARSLLVRAAPSALAWLVSRAIVVALYATTESMVIGDVHYYRNSLNGLGSSGLEHTLPEYPVPAVALLWIPYGLTHLLGLPSYYSWACAGLVLALDALFTGILIARRISMTEPRHGSALARLEFSMPEIFWILALPALGATSLARFDIVPGIFVALALLFTIHHPRFAGAAAAIATAVKYWPAIIIPALLSPSSVRRRLIAGGALTGAVIALASLAWGGPHRLVTPLTYQDTRGLQIESILATPAVVAWGFAQGDPWRIFYAPSKSYEIQGPLVGSLEHVSTAISLGAVALLLWLWWRAWRNLRTMDHGVALNGEDPRIPTQLVWLTLTSVLMFVVTSKVFSPQYLLWILPATVVGLAVLTEPTQKRIFLKWSAALLAVTVATQYIFPLHYGALISIRDDTRSLVLLLAARNLTVLALAVVAVRETFLATRAADRPRHPSTSTSALPQMNARAS